MKDYKQLIFGLAFLTLQGCVSLKTVEVEKPVDTSNKKINKQEKKVFELADLGVFASNNFDGARLNDFEKLNDSTALVWINPENEPINYSPFYAFKTWATTPKTFYFKFKYNSPYKHRYFPKTYTNGTWKALDSTAVVKIEDEVTVRMDLTKEPQYISAQELHNSAAVSNWTQKIIAGKDWIQLKSAGKSVLGRNLPYLDISKGDTKNKPVILLLTRQHPPEVTGYLAFQEFLKALIAEHDLNDLFFKKYRVLAFPIMNPDGVDLGHWRHNANGIDLNRDWSVYQQPEVRNAVKVITKTLKKSKSNLVLGLDFHSTWYDVFYTNEEREKTALPNFIQDWFRYLEANVPGYKVNEKPKNSTTPVSKAWMLYGHKAAGITYEIGDETPRDQIKLIGATSAKAMMQILTEN